jgi:glutamate 5-kinase
VGALIEGARHTRIAAQRDPMQARKAWIAGQLHPKGCLVVDDGAARALLDGASLLPSGVQAVSGAFEKGDAVDITTQGAAPFARGIIAYDQGEAARLMGAKSGEIETRLGYAGAVSLVHRDDLVILRSAHTDSAGMEAFLP